ncbi:precorrin-6A reductase [Streptococcus catagoni]|uniref:precorrin-6A reductase n=1 Tax=Streptococcus catagoni TaxID=2654874 RepID=UPI00140E40FE|nr:precorrin-6A reductase [Streptococcus catagoni]
MKKLLLGGTSDSTAILTLLNQLKIPVITSVVTDYGRHLAEKWGQPVHQGSMTASDMLAFINHHQIDEIIDATHPFADVVSKEAMTAAKEAGISYIRFERQRSMDLTGAILATSTQEAIDILRAKNYQTIYLGTGSKTLPLFVNQLRDRRIVARVLPTSEVLLACEKLGLVADQIDAIKAPFSKACHRELIARTKADVFVSKESGTVGGVREKIDACIELGIDCIIISRPQMDYPKMVSRIEELEAYLNDGSEK